MSIVFTPKHGRWLAKLVIGACLILACIALTRKVQAAFLNNQVKTMMAEMKNLKMKSVCVGRFLFDVPADAEVSYRGAMIAGWSISTYDETDEQFAARVEKKEAQLSGEKNEKGMPSLESTQQVDKNGVHGKIHVFGREWIRGLPTEPLSESVRVEAMIRMKQRSFNLTREFGNDGYLKKLAELVTQFRSRDENEIPMEAGYCFDGGFITEPITVEQAERTTMFVGLNGHPDVSIALSMIAGITTRETLLERDARNSVGDKYRSRYHTFRRGTRPLNGQAGEELLERIHEFNGNYGHVFMWEAVHTKTDSVFTPDMSFELSTGHAQPGTNVDSSLTDAEALVLWDKMLSSLRVRPVVAAKLEAVAPPQVPRGTWAKANEVCPQTGWWECTDGDEGVDIVGGRQQFYRAGEGMAQAIQLMPATGWKRLTGEQPTFTSKIPSSWKLVIRRETRRSAAIAVPPQSPIVSGDAVAHSPDTQSDVSLLPGAMAGSGMPCPASGWWRCVDALALDATRWFQFGQDLPMATLRQSMPLSERLNGTPNVVSQKVTWQFIRHDAGADDMPKPPPEDDGADTMV